MADLSSPQAPSGTSLQQQVKLGAQTLTGSAQDVAKLSGAAAASPIEAATAGGLPQQASQAGTPNALRNAVQLSTKGTQGLGTAVREQQNTAQANAATTAEAQQAQQMQQAFGSGNLATRVMNTVTTDLGKLSAATTVQGMSVDPSQIAASYQVRDANGNPTGQVIQGSDVSSALETIANPAASQQAILNAMDLVSTATGTPLSGATAGANPFQSMYLNKGDPQTQAANVIAANSNAPAQIKMAQMDPSQFGFTSYDQMGALLSIPGQTPVTGSQIAGMTPEQLSALVQSVQSGKFNTTQGAMNVLSDPTANANVRAAARATLTAAGATGIATAEQSVASLTSQVASNLTITVPGTTTPVPLDQALSSTNLTALAMGLTDPANAATNLTALEGIIGKDAADQFNTYVQNNLTAFQQYGAGIGQDAITAATQSASIQHTMSSLPTAASTYLGYVPGEALNMGNLPPAMQSLNQPGTTLYQLSQDNLSGQTSDLTASISLAAQLPPTVMNASTFQQLMSLPPGSIPSSSVMKTYTDQIQVNYLAQNDATLGVPQAISAITGGGTQPVVTKNVAILAAASSILGSAFTGNTLGVTSADIASITTNGQLDAGKLVAVGAGGTTDLLQAIQQGGAGGASWVSSLGSAGASSVNLPDAVANQVLQQISSNGGTAPTPQQFGSIASSLASATTTSDSPVANQAGLAQIAQLQQYAQNSGNASAVTQVSDVGTQLAQQVTNTKAAGALGTAFPSVQAALTSAPSQLSDTASYNAMTSLLTLAQQRAADTSLTSYETYQWQQIAAGASKQLATYENASAANQAAANQGAGKVAASEGKAPGALGSVSSAVANSIKGGGLIA